jgi:RNA polymerase sigma factor (TIGR02999 family)
MIMKDHPANRAAHEVTQLLQLARGGDSRAAEELLPLVYEELRRLAHGRMAREPIGGAGQTLQATALVHEAYLRLLGPDGQQLNWEGRAHFFGAAARAMRRILIERARSRKRVKRGGGMARIELSEVGVTAEDSSLDSALELEAALSELESLDRRKAEVVMLRYFGGLSIEETALALNVSPATVKNDWTFARAWLQRRIGQLMQSDSVQADDSDPPD